MTSAATARGCYVTSSRSRGCERGRLTAEKARDEREERPALVGASLELGLPLPDEAVERVGVFHDLMVAETLY